MGPDKMSSRPQRKIVIRRGPREHHAAKILDQLLSTRKLAKKDDPKRHLPDDKGTDSNPKPLKEPQIQGSAAQTLEERLLYLSDSWKINIEKLNECNHEAVAFIEKIRVQNLKNTTLRQQLVVLKQKIKQQENIIQEQKECSARLTKLGYQLHACKGELRACKQVDTLRKMVWG